MSDSGMKGRVKGLLAGTPPAPREPADEQHPEPPLAATSMSDPHAQQRALQVLTLAQRTADEHVASAHRQADKICADARATAEQIVREAEAHAQQLQREADKALSEARATAGQIGREAQAHADSTRRDRSEERRVGKECRSRWSPSGRVSMVLADGAFYVVGEEPPEIGRAHV